MRARLEVSTDYGYDISISEEDLDSITATELWKLRMSHPVLKRCEARRIAANIAKLPDLLKR